MTKSTKTPPKKAKEPKRAAKKGHVTKKPPAKMGRPSAMTPEVLAKLDTAFMCGASNAEAAVFAGIHEATLQRHIAANPDFSERISALKGQPRLLAKALVVGELQKGNLSVAWEVLERGRVDGYTKPTEPSKPGVQVNVNAAPLAPGETDEGRKALEALHALFSGRALPGPEHQGEG